ncbi:MAG: hypothetical protein HZA17_12480, partial [Nitrospirae bacterium]|nr:hypothetical protein [Nitrospirota bacterium]
MKKFILPVIAILFLVSHSVAEEKKPYQSIDSRFALIKGGCFQMGSSSGDGNADEKPVHE